MSLLLTVLFSEFLEPYNLESSNFLRRCEYIARKTPSKNTLKFLKHFSYRSIHKLFLDYPVDSSFKLITYGNKKNPRKIRRKFIAVAKVGRAITI